MALRTATEYRYDGSEWRAKPLLPASVRKHRFQPSDVDAPAKVADQLTKLLESQDLVNRALAADPQIGPRLFLDVACGTGGATAITVATDMGRPAFWHVVRWRRTTPGGTHGLEELTNDGVTLSLRSYVAGVATILVF